MFGTQLLEAPRGQRLQVRAAGPEDADLISAFVSALSPQTQYLRFFAAVAPPSASLLRALSGADERADILVATTADGTIVGHAMAADRTGPRGEPVSHIGLVVADEWQLRGIGTQLLGLLVPRAAGRGVGTLVLDVLPTNSRMLGMIERRWPRLRREFSADSVTLYAPLAGQPARAGDQGSIGSAA
jgi:GNAT superfamily N-acetyltransferase